MKSWSLIKSRFLFWIPFFIFKNLSKSPHKPTDICYHACWLTHNLNDSYLFNCALYSRYFMNHWAFAEMGEKRENMFIFDVYWGWLCLLHALKTGTLRKELEKENENGPKMANKCSENKYIWGIKQHELLSWFYFSKLYFSTIFLVFYNLYTLNITIK